MMHHCDVAAMYPLQDSTWKYKVMGPDNIAASLLPCTSQWFPINESHELAPEPSRHPAEELWAVPA